MDRCFRNSHKPYSFDELLTYINSQLEEVFGDVIKTRTLRNDIKLFRDSEKGFGAPLITDKFYEKEVYYYEDPNFSIAQCRPLEDEQYILDAAIQLLERYEENPYYNKLSEALLYLEDKGHTIDIETDKYVLYYDKNEAYEGLNLLKPFYMAIKKQKVLQICYQGFKDRIDNKFIFHPHVLKQYNQRWFVFGYNETSDKEKWSLPLDSRIISYKELPDKTYIESIVNWQDHFKQLVGIRDQSMTNEHDQPETVVLRFSDQRIDYFKTKPIHPEWDEYLDESKKNQVFFDCVINHELIQQILSYGNDVEVLEPKALRSVIAEKTKQMLKHYDD